MHIVGVVGLLFAFIQVIHQVSANLSSLIVFMFFQLFGLVSSMMLFCGLSDRRARYMAVKR